MILVAIYSNYLACICSVKVLQVPVGQIIDITRKWMLKWTRRGWLVYTIAISCFHLSQGIFTMKKRVYIISEADVSIACRDDLLIVTTTLEELFIYLLTIYSVIAQIIQFCIAIIPVMIFGAMFVMECIKSGSLHGLKWPQKVRQENRLSSR